MLISIYCETFLFALYPGSFFLAFSFIYRLLGYARRKSCFKDGVLATQICTGTAPNKRATSERSYGVQASKVCNMYGCKINKALVVYF